MPAPKLTAEYTAPVLNAYHWAGAERRASRAEEDPVLARLAQAPIDDEPFTHEEAAAFDAAMADDSTPWPEAEPVRPLKPV